MELFCGNSERVKLVDCFRRTAPSLMFDGFVNVTMCEEVSATGVLHKGITNSFCLLILLIHTKHKNNKMKSCTGPMSSFPLRRFIHWVDKTENV